MNERQRDLFLWQWARRRTRGLAGVTRRGALVGAGGGLLFSAILLSGMGVPTGTGYTGLSAILPVLERAALLLGTTVPALAFVGALEARRVYHLHETRYLALQQAGARVPACEPVLQAADRWPAIAVGVAAAAIGGCVLALIAASATGRL